MASFFTAVAPNSSAPSPSASAAAAASQAPQVTEQQFLQLLVAQLQHQDPLSPMDGTQFVSQLAQFSELEQMIGINTGVQQLVTGSQNGGQTPGNSSTGAGSGAGNTAPAKP